jgi:hypothetical protein
MGSSSSWDEFVDVKVGFRIISAGDIDAARGTFFCRVQVAASWVEPQLINCTAARAARLSCRVTDDISCPQSHVPDWDQEGLFDPGLHITNAASASAGRSIRGSTSGPAVTDFSWKVGTL